MKTIVWKPLIIKIIKPRFKYFDNKYLKKDGGHVGRNVVEIAIKMKTIVRKPLMIKNHQASFQRFWQQTPEEGRWTYRAKRCGNNHKDEDNSPKILNDKNYQASSQKFRPQTPEEGRGTYRAKRCGNNNKDEDNCPKTLNDKNHQASFQKFWQMLFCCSIIVVCFFRCCAIER